MAFSRNDIARYLFVVCTALQVPVYILGFVLSFSFVYRYLTTNCLCKMLLVIDCKLCVVCVVLLKLAIMGLL